MQTIDFHTHLLSSEGSVITDKKYQNFNMLNQPLACGVKTISAHMGLDYSNISKHFQELQNILEILF